MYMLLNVYAIGTTCFSECLIPYDNWKTLIFIQVYRYYEVSFNRHVFAFFQASVLKSLISSPLSQLSPR